MREYIVEQSSLTYKWTFQRMLPSLPGPGTPAFAELCKELHPYGISPSRVTVDTPSIRLSDVTVGIGLLDNRVALRLTSSAFELWLDELLEDDEEKLIPIADLVFTALSSIDADVVQGDAKLRISSHLRLSPLENDALLREHIKFFESVPHFIPDAVVYKIDFGQDSNAQELRIAIANSHVYPDSIFVDITADYKGPISNAQLAEQMNTDYERIIGTLGLKQQVEPVEDTVS